MTENKESNWGLIAFGPKNFTELVDFIAEHGRIEISTQPNDWEPEQDNNVSAKIVRRRMAAAMTRGQERWAWCCVHVTVFFIDGYKGAASLGGCCYSSIESFRNSNQFEKLLREAAEDCARSMWTAAKKIVAICEGR